MKRQICFIALCLTISVLVACSNFQKPGTTDSSGTYHPGANVVAPDPAKIEADGQAASGAVSVIPVWGQLLGTLILLGTTWAAAHYRGKEVGWTEAVGTPAVPAVPGQAKPVSST